MECVRYVGWATSSHATVKIRLYVFKKKEKKNVSSQFSKVFQEWGQLTYSNEVECDSKKKR
jgi:hypothetical protein